MSREVHVRIWEGVGVRFPHATRLDWISSTVSKTVGYTLDISLTLLK